MQSHTHENYNAETQTQASVSCMFTNRVTGTSRNSSSHCSQCVTVCQSMYLCVFPGNDPENFTLPVSDCMRGCCHTHTHTHTHTQTQTHTHTHTQIPADSSPGNNLNFSPLFRLSSIHKHQTMGLKDRGGGGEERMGRRRRGEGRRRGEERGGGGEERVRRAMER